MFHAVMQQRVAVCTVTIHEWIGRRNSSLDREQCGWNELPVYCICVKHARIVNSHLVSHTWDRGLRP